jgi:hypothetical protein
MGLYKGLGAVLGGIIPKMAIRFTSYEYYKQLLANSQTGQISRKGTFLGSWTKLPLFIVRLPCKRKLIFCVECFGAQLDWLLASQKPSL